MSDEKPFSLSATRYDMTTYFGRCKHFYRAIDPRNLLCTPTEISDSLSKMDACRAGKRDPKWTNAELWKARGVVEACVHPQTREVIPAPVRMCALIPVNLYIVPYMLLPTTIASPIRTIWIHWFNQSYNCAVNYANRSSDSVPVSILAQGYAAAVTLSIGVSLGAGKIMKSIPAGTATANGVRALLPFLAVAMAGGANVSLMRQDEWNGRGVDVKDDDGNVIGRSNAAGRIGVLKCAAARFLWNIPVMVLPPLMMIPIGRIGFIKRNPSGLVLAETACCVFGMGFGIAPGLAAFQPYDRVHVSRLEPEFHNMKDKSGKKIDYVTYYKGL